MIDMIYHFTANSNVSQCVSFGSSQITHCKTNFEMNHLLIVFGSIIFKQTIDKRIKLMI